MGQTGAQGRVALPGADGLECESGVRGASRMAKRNGRRGLAWSGKCAEPERLFEGFFLPNICLGIFSHGNE